MGDTRSAIWRILDMFPGYLAKSVNMPPIDANASNGQILNDMGEVEIFNCYDARLGLEKEIGA